MALNFAPYQSGSPETQRALSPPPARTTSPRRSFSPPIVSSNSKASNYSRMASPPHGGNASGGGGSGGGNGFVGSYWADSAAADVESGGSGHGGLLGPRAQVSEFETSLPLRLDYEACLAYLLLPPAGGVLLLVLEWKSDYVRFHAWQSSLLFSALFVLHLLFSWSSWLSWVLLLADLALIMYLTMRAYRDAETLDRCEVPVIGALASRILDDE